MLAKLSFNYIDIILLIVWIIAVLEGLYKGLIKQVFGILALILACYVSYHLQDLLPTALWNGSMERGRLRIVAFIATFILVLIGVTLLGHLLDKLLKIVLLGWLNRLTGAIFGWIKWNILVVILVYVLNLFDAMAFSCLPKPCIIPPVPGG